MAFEYLVAATEDMLEELEDDDLEAAADTGCSALRTLLHDVDFDMALMAIQQRCHQVEEDGVRVGAVTDAIGYPWHERHLMLDEAIAAVVEHDRVFKLFLQVEDLLLRQAGAGRRTSRRLAKVATELRSSLYGQRMNVERFRGDLHRLTERVCGMSSGQVPIEPAPVWLPPPEAEPDPVLEERLRRRGRQRRWLGGFATSLVGATTVLTNGGFIVVGAFVGVDLLNGNPLVQQMSTLLGGYLVSIGANMHTPPEP